MEKVQVSKEIMQDAINIANGVYKPLVGFLYEVDCKEVLERMRLSTGEVWPIPIVLDVNEKVAEDYKDSQEMVITDGEREVKLENIQIYKYDKKEFAFRVFGTVDEDHPGVKQVMERGDYLVGGKVEVIKNLENHLFQEYNLTPYETKEVFRKNGWQTIVAFQTRNVPHRSHEHLQKFALEKVDGLFIHPVIGRKKPGDFKDEVIIASYKILLDKYYPKHKTHLGILPIRMYYAGPKEALMHALIRRNYGCTHMIIGRDHAGVGNYYDPYAAHKIFNQFSKDELGIEIMKFSNVHYCKKCKELVFEDNCDHDEEEKFLLSGTKMREMIRNKEELPEELIRPEVSEFLIKCKDPFVS